MAKGRDTHNFRIDKQVISELLHGVDQPQLLKAVFDKANDICFGRCSAAEFDAFCATLPCLLWSPDDPTDRNVTVRVAGEEDRVMIKVTRVVWRITHVVPAQGPDLRGHEDLLHSCGRNGHSSTAKGACLNPAHLFRGTPDNRVELAALRRNAKKLGMAVIAHQSMGAEA